MPANQMIQLHDTNCMQLMYMTDSLYFPSGTQYKYSNTGYSILSLIVEQISGQPFAQFLKENIFKKIGMVIQSFPRLDPCSTQKANVARNLPARHRVFLWNVTLKQAAKGSVTSVRVCL